MEETSGAVWWEDLLDTPFKEENTITIRGVNLIIPFPHHTFDVAGDRITTYTTGVMPPISSSHHRLFSPKEFKSGFVGENFTLEKYENFKEEEKVKIQSILWKTNKDWLEEKFQELKAEWIIVIDGEVKTSSSDLAEYPQESEVLKICEETGKFPFVFVNRRLLMIEESSSTWSETKYPNDYYPTAKIRISSSKLPLGVEITADLDTGAPTIYLDMERLISDRVIIPPSNKDIPDTGEHLGEEYYGYWKFLFIGVTSEDGKSKKEKFWGMCVRKWGESPFIKINKSRDALVGRELFQKLQAIVLLDFWKRKTKIYL